MSFHTVVCIKAIQIQAPTATNERSAETMALNPFDGSTIEMALRTREEKGGTVTALSMGPQAGAFVLNEARAMGVDRTVLLSDPALAGSDTLATSTALAAGLKRLAPYDLVLFGTRTADSDTGQVGPQVAVLLDLPLVGCVRQISWKNNHLFVERLVDGYIEQFDMSLPGALTIDPVAIRTRDLPLGRIRTAFDESTVEIWDLDMLGLEEDAVGLKGSPTVVVSLKRNKRERECRNLEGSAEEQVEELVRTLVDKGLIGS
jgi:electron transfer flavoprotein beta subunit